MFFCSDLVRLYRLVQFSITVKGLHPVKLACLQANQTKNLKLKDKTEETPHIFESSRLETFCATCLFLYYVWQCYVCYAVLYCV